MAPKQPGGGSVPNAVISGNPSNGPGSAVTSSGSGLSGGVSSSNSVPLSSFGASPSAIVGPPGSNGGLVSAPGSSINTSSSR